MKGRQEDTNRVLEFIQTHGDVEIGSNVQLHYESHHPKCNTSSTSISSAPQTTITIFATSVNSLQDGVEQNGRTKLGQSCCNFPQNSTGQPRHFGIGEDWDSQAEATGRCEEAEIAPFRYSTALKRSVGKENPGDRKKN